MLNCDFDAEIGDDVVAVMFGEDETWGELMKLGIDLVDWAVIGGLQWWYEVFDGSERWLKW